MNFLHSFNNFIWGGPMMVLLLGTHLWLTLRLHFVQRKVGQGLRLAIGRHDSTSSSGRLSGLGTLTTTLAATLGTGNIIGVGTAVFLGGPGAVFWCWLTGLLGMATSYTEAYLCTKFKDPDSGLGGPMVLLKNQLHHPLLAMCYSIFLCLSAFFVGCTTQTSAIVIAVHSLTPSVPPFIIGISCAILVGFILLGQGKRLEYLCNRLVVFMGLLFMGLCSIFLVYNIAYLGDALLLIMKSVANSNSLTAGLTGFAVTKSLRYGIARGLFTNEAGLGTAGVIGASSHHSPGEQGLISMCATFFDTVIMCGVTGIVVVIYLLRYPGSLALLSSGTLTFATFATLPFGSIFLSISLILFAFATLIGWCYIGEQGAAFVAHDKGTLIYHCLYLLAIIGGALISFNIIWEVTDFINLFLALPCLYAIVALRRFVNRF